MTSGVGERASFDDRNLQFGTRLFCAFLAQPIPELLLFFRQPLLFLMCAFLRMKILLSRKTVVSRARDPASCWCPARTSWKPRSNGDSNASSNIASSSFSRSSSKNSYNKMVIDSHSAIMHKEKYNAAMYRLIRLLPCAYGPVLRTRHNKCSLLSYRKGPNFTVMSR